MHCVASRFGYPNYRLSELSLVPFISDNPRSILIRLITDAERLVWLLNFTFRQDGDFEPRIFWKQSYMDAAKLTC